MNTKEVLLENIRIFAARKFYIEFGMNIADIILIDDVSELIHCCVTLGISDEEIIGAIYLGREFVEQRLNFKERKAA